MKKFLLYLFSILLLSCDEVPDLYAFYNFSQDITVDDKSLRVRARAKFSSDKHLIITLDQGGSYFTIILDSLQLQEPYLMEESERNLIFYGLYSNTNNPSASGSLLVTKLEVNYIQISGNFNLTNEVGNTKYVEFEELNCYFTHEQAYFNTGFTYEYQGVSLGNGTILNLTTQEEKNIYFYISDEFGSVTRNWSIIFFPVSDGNGQMNSYINFYTANGIQPGQPINQSCDFYFDAYYKGKDLYCQDSIEINNIEKREKEDYSIYTADFSVQLAEVSGSNSYRVSLELEKYALQNY